MMPGGGRSQEEGILLERKELGDQVVQHRQVSQGLCRSFL